MTLEPVPMHYCQRGGTMCASETEEQAQIGPGSCRQHGRTRTRARISPFSSHETRRHVRVEELHGERSCGGDPLALELLDPPREAGEV